MTLDPDLADLAATPVSFVLHNDPHRGCGTGAIDGQRHPRFSPRNDSKSSVAASNCTGGAWPDFTTLTAANEAVHAPAGTG